MMLLSLFLLLGSMQLSSAVPQPISDRQATPPVVLPTKLAVSSYAGDYTWTVTATTFTVATEATSFRIRASTITTNGGVPTQSPVTATLMGVVTTSSFYWPPPEITATVSQRIRITLINNLPIQTVNGVAHPKEKVTLHFHGLYQEHSYGSMDGPESVTQCGVDVDDIFVYDFPVTHAGTYWIHSHDPGQYPKGLRSALIVKDPSETYDSDNTVTLSDWYPDFWNTERLYRQKDCGNGIEDLGPDFAATFNDYVPGIHTSNRFYEVKTGSNRFRFINFSAFSPFFVKFENQRVTVIEIDGVLVDAPGDTEGFVIMPGQRISVKFTALAGRSDYNYRIVAAIDPRFMPKVPDSQNCFLPYWAQNITSYTWGCFYSGPKPSSCAAPTLADFPFIGYKWHAPAGNPRLEKTLNTTWHWDMQTPAAYPWDFNEKLLTPKAGQPGNTSPSSPLDLSSPKKENVHFFTINDYDSSLPNSNSDYAGYGTLNNDAGSNDLWVPPAQPGFLRATQEGASLGDASTYGTESNTIIVENTDDVVWLVINTVRGDHPMHLHGQHFQLLYRGFEDDVSIEAYRNAISTYQTTGNPTGAWEEFRFAVKQVTPAAPLLTRDTILASKYQFMILAFKAENPGVWALHCHNDFHASSGMMKQVVVDPTKLRQRLGTWNINNTAISYNKPADTSQWDQTTVDALLRNVAQCNPGSLLPADVSWHLAR